MDLVVVGLSHRTAPVEVRERLSVAATDLEGRLRQLSGLPGVGEVLVLSTCNRLEIYAACADAVAGLAALREDLRAAFRVGDDPAAIAGDELDGHLYTRLGREAVHHLFRVTASLDSMVVGEPQILGQVKDAFDVALRARTAGPALGFVFQRAFRVARKVRRETGIARQTTSVSSVAVELARLVWSDFQGLRVLLIGAGKMAGLAARSLHRSGARLAVTNRTAARAQELAARLGCDVEPFADLAGALVRADIVITSTGAREPILGAPMLAEVQRRRRRRPLVLIDIAVPRDVDPAARQVEAIYLYDIDDIQDVADQHRDGRRQEASAAETLVEEELARALAAHRGRAVGPTISALRARTLAIAQAEADKALAGLHALDDRGRRVVQQMAEAIAAKILHAPQVALRKSAGGDEGETLLAAAHVLFDLPTIEAIDGERTDDEEAAGTHDKQAAGS